jgi:methionyl-tRNA synthetase
VLGKDILRFHAVYWPAFLFALGLQPPRRLLVHAHWLAGRAKMAKSRGNVVCPEAAASELGGPVFGVDALRYFLLRAGNPAEDGSRFFCCKI